MPTTSEHEQANVPPAVEPGKSERIPTSVSFQSVDDVRVIDMAATLAGMSRSAWIVGTVVPAAERDLRAAGIDPDAIRRAA